VRRGERESGWVSGEWLSYPQRKDDRSTGLPRRRREDRGRTSSSFPIPGWIVQPMSVRHNPTSRPRAPGGHRPLRGEGTRPRSEGTIGPIAAASWNGACRGRKGGEGAPNHRIRWAGRCYVRVRQGVRSGRTRPPERGVDFPSLEKGSMQTPLPSETVPFDRSLARDLGKDSDAKQGFLPPQTPPQSLVKPDREGRV